MVILTPESCHPTWILPAQLWALPAPRHREPADSPDCAWTQSVSVAGGGPSCEQSRGSVPPVAISRQVCQPCSWVLRAPLASVPPTPLFTLDLFVSRFDFGSVLCTLTWLKGQPSGGGRKAILSPTLKCTGCRMRQVGYS